MSCFQNKDSRGLVQIFCNGPDPTKSIGVRMQEQTIPLRYHDRKLAVIEGMLVPLRALLAPIEFLNKISAVALLSMMSLAFVDVFMRYFSNPISGAMELTEL